MANTQKAFFVNKTINSKTLSKSEGAERLSIYSHVQKGHSSSCSKSSSVDADKQNSDKQNESETQSAYLRNTFSRLKIQNKNKPNQKAKRQTSVAIVPPPAPSPSHDLKPAELDPFDTTQVRINQYMFFLLKFYNSALMAHVYPTKELAEISRQYTFSFASSDPIFLNALLCTTSAALHAREGTSTHEVSALYFKGQAISHLKQSLSDQTAKPLRVSSIYATSLLLWTECLGGNTDDVQTHIRGLEQMVSRIHGINQSPLPVMSTILACSHLCAAMTYTPPTLAPPSLPDVSLSQPTFEALDARLPNQQLMATGFYKHENAPLLGPELLELTSQQLMPTLLKILCMQGCVTPTYTDFQLAYTTGAATHHRLLALPFNMAEAPLTGVQEAVRLALFTFAQPLVALLGSHTAFARSITAQLKAALERADAAPLWQAGWELLLWLLFVGAHISTGHEEWAWFAVHFSSTVRALGIESLEMLRETLAQYYYLDESFGRSLWDIWEAKKCGW